MEHNFNTDVAIKYGLTEAILIHNFRFWISKNRSNGNNFHDGKYWTYNSVSSLKELFPYLTERQIAYSIEKLLKCGVLHKGNFNVKQYDRTSWYTLDECIEVYYTAVEEEVKPLPSAILQNCEMTLQNCEMDSTNLLNAFDKFVKPIPYTSTYINTDIISLDRKKILKKEIADVTKEIKKIEKKRNPTAEKDKLWESYVKEWIDINIEKSNFKPVINARECKSLKLIVEQLRLRAVAKNIEWNEQSAIPRLHHFFIAAYSKDDWLRKNFTLSTIYNQINQVFKIAENVRESINEHKPKSGSTKFGKATGAISLIDDLHRQFTESSQGNSQG